MLKRSIYSGHNPALKLREGSHNTDRLKGLEDFSTSIPIYQQSRGILPKSFLESPSDVSTTDFAKTLVQSGNAASTGGFTLVCGEMRGRSPLAIVSNRSQIKENLERVENEDGDLIGSSDDQGVFWILGKHEQLERRSTVAFSNVAFSDRSWPKVINGEQIAEEVLARSIYAKDDEDALAQRLFRDVLSVDTLPRVDEENEQIELLKQSIFVPLICRDDKAKIRETHGKSASKVDTQEETAHEDLKTKQGELPTYLRGAYGTQTQTIIMLHESGQVAYFERVLYDSDARPIPVEQRDHIHRFKLEN